MAEWSIVVPFAGLADPTPNTDSNANGPPSATRFPHDGAGQTAGLGGGQPSHLESLSGFEVTAGV